MGYSDMDISKYVVSAICGCWAWESGCNPQIWESLVVKSWDYIYGTDGTSMGGYGLGQWTNTGDAHGRLWDLHTWVTSNGYSDGDGNGQLEYMLVENHWVNSQYSRLGITSLTQFLTSNSTDLNSLVWDFLACWEGVRGNRYSERCGYASDILAFINQHENDGQTYTWIGGNIYLNESQRNNNAMVIYNYMTSGGSHSGQYSIYCSSTGNGYCRAIPNTHDALPNEHFTIYCMPYGSDTFVSVTAHDANGYPVAIYDEPIHQYDADAFPFDLWVEAVFTGEQPPDPPIPPPTSSILAQHRMKIWQYPMFKV